MIPIAWLHERLDTTDPEELARRDLRRLGVDPAEWDRLHAGGGFARWRRTWDAFLGQIAPGDALWFYTSPPETWNDMAGTAGYAIVRGGEPIHVLTSRRS